MYILTIWFFILFILIFLINETEPMKVFIYFLFMCYAIKRRVLTYDEPHLIPFNIHLFIEF